MKLPDLRRRLSGALEDLDWCRSRLARGVRNLDEWGGLGFPVSSLGESDIGHSRGVSDPVGDLAAAVVDGDLRDELRLERAGIDEDVEEIGLALERLRKRLVRATETASRSKAPPECRLCAVELRSTVIYASERCRWHYDFWREWGVDAARGLTVLHLQDRRISTARILEEHPELRDRASSAR